MAFDCHSCSEFGRFGSTGSFSRSEFTHADLARGTRPNAQAGGAHELSAILAALHVLPADPNHRRGDAVSPRLGERRGGRNQWDERSTTGCFE